MISFNIPPKTGNEEQYVLQAIRSEKISGDSYFGKKCQQWFESKLGCKKSLLTPSCTAALEIAAILIDIQPGDEVIMPSYTFVSTANAFVLRGARIIFVDVRPDTMNIDENLIEAAITKKTKAIVPVHYAGVACEMDCIMDIASRYGLYVIEDAAQGVMSAYKGRPLGTIGHLAAYSFHETKNYTSGGEGGLLIVNDEALIHRAEVIREKGTNRSLFFRGQVDKYTWVDLGSSFLPSELQAAYLWGQLERVDEIKENRVATWEKYNNAFQSLLMHCIDLPSVPVECEHNGHMYYLKLKNIKQREKFIKYLKDHGVMSVFHYIPLHSSPAGKLFSVFYGEDKYTTQDSEKLVRLPMYYGMDMREHKKVVDTVLNFFLNPN